MKRPGNGDLARFVGRERNTEVDDLRFGDVSALDQQDVLRLDVTVHDAFTMRVCERFEDLLRDADRIGEAEKALLREEASEIFRSSAEGGAA